MDYLLSRLLERSADRHPERPAVVFRDRQISYGDLVDLSNRLANALRTAGVRPGNRVGLYLPKSIEAIAAIFGVLKAGAAYVPLDPMAPPRRISLLMQDCGIRTLFCSTRKAGELLASIEEPLTSETTLILSDSGDATSLQLAPAGVTSVWNWSDVLQQSSQSVAARGVIEDDLAYILYTSGSTGRPKGVMISHRAALTFVNWAFDYFQVREDEVVSNHAPLHFDLSVFDIFVTVRSGAAIHPVPPEISVFPLEVAEFIESHRISTWYSVPSALTALLLHGQLEKRSYPALKRILFAGEVFPLKHLRRLMELFPGTSYYNLYGPTETNVCTVYAVSQLPSETDSSLPIGKACDNTQVLALTEDGREAETGEIGELYVRGPSLMKGYWADLAKTQQTTSFRSFGTAQWPEKVYRTGDLVKRRADGNYLFLGRRDEMVKSRGYRIELGEIENILYAHPRVEHVAVFAVPDEQVGNRLKATVVSKSGVPVAERELREHCLRLLPRYMVPDIFEFRASLPLTSSGKVDKQGLISTLTTDYEGQI